MNDNEKTYYAIFYSAVRVDGKVYPVKWSNQHNAYMGDDFTFIDPLDLEDHPQKLHMWILFETEEQAQVVIKHLLQYERFLSSHQIK